MSVEDPPEEDSVPPSSESDTLLQARVEASRLEDELHATDDPDEADALRLQLARHYLEILEDAVSAASHVEELLGRDNVPSDVLDIATGLLDYESIAAPIAERLSAAYRRLGRPGSEAATLRRELGLAQPPRLTEVKRRLAEIRFSELGDLEGALELLEPLVLDDPADDALRAAYLTMVRDGDAIDRGATLLGRAIDAERDPAARARVAIDLGEILLEAASWDRAKQALLIAVTSAPDGPSALEAARRLLRLEPAGGNPSIYGPALAVLARQEPEAEARAAAAQQLDESQFDVIPALEQAGEWMSLVGVLEAVVDLAPEDERAPLLAQIGQVRLDHLGDVEGALEALRQSLVADPRNGLGRTTLEQLMARGEHRGEAAAILEPIYRGEGNDKGTLRAVATRAEVAATPVKRLALLGRALDVARRGELGTAAAVGLFNRAFRESLAHLPEDVPHWIDRLHAFTRDAGDLAAETRVLQTALGERALDSEHLVALARALLDALEASGDTGGALAIAEKLFEAGDASVALAARIDALGGTQHDPKRRLSRYEAALGTADAAERTRLLHDMAALARDELDDLPRALSLWQKILDEDPHDPVAVDGLLGAYERFDDPQAVLDEVENALEFAQGSVRQRLIQRKAQALSKLGERDAALGLLDRLLDAPDIPEPNIEAIATTAQDEDAPEIYRRALERLSNSVDAGIRMSALERLGDFHYETMGDRLAAIQSWKPAARLHTLDPEEDAHARELYERVLDASPDDTEAAEKLVEIYSRAGEWSRVPEVFSVLLRVPERLDATVDLLLGLESDATEAAAVDELLSMIDEAQPLIGQDARDAARRLMRAKARVLSSDPGRQSAASEAYRTLIEVYGSERDVGAYEVFVDSRGNAQERQEDLRWIYEWKAAHTADPVPTLIEWAALEEANGELEIAAHALKRASGLAPERSDILDRLVGVERSAGNPEGALSALRRLRRAAEASRGRGLDLRIAALLMNDLGRPEEAVLELAGLLAEEPPDPDALALVEQGLATPGGTAQVADTLERFALEDDDPGRAVRTLELLTRAPHRTTLPAERRARWWSRLADLRPDDATVLDELVMALHDVPSDLDLWKRLETVARKLERPAAMGDAFRGALGAGQLTPDVADPVGKHVVDFLDEFSSSGSDVVPILLGILDHAPKARWALDRVKLVLSSQGRWNEFFALFDKAIDDARDDEIRADLLDEAAVAARDLAEEPERALEYLERLKPLRPDDTGLRASLERLYERLGRSAKLVELLTARLETARGVNRRDVLKRLASLQLDLGAGAAAWAALDALLSDGAPVRDVVESLERLAVLQDGYADPELRARAVDLLLTHYETSSRVDDVIRVASAALGAALGPEREAELLRRLTVSRLAALGAQVNPLSTLIAQMRAAAGSEPFRQLVVAESVLELAHGRASGGNDADALDACWWAVRTQAGLLDADGRKADAIETLRGALSLPFPPPRSRSLRRDLALALREAGELDQAQDELRRLFEEDVSDDVATSCLDPFVELLGASGRYRELAELWERIARRRIASDRAAAKDAWERAARVWTVAGDRGQAIRAHTEAAHLGSATARRELIAHHSEHGNLTELAEVRREGFEQSRGEERFEHALALGEVHQQLGTPELAIEPLEQIVRESPNLWSVREQLAALYRATGANAALAELLRTGAQLGVPKEQRVAALLEIARLYQGPLEDAAQAVAALEQAAQLSPHDPKLSLSLGRALCDVERFEQAASVLRRQLEAFDDRRPKRRAAIHHQLARSLAASDRTAAVEELKRALEIDPAHTGALYDLARAALEMEDLDLAESTYRALLLALRRAPTDGDGPSRVAAYLDLSEIAARRGDDTRAGDLVESAFASAETDPSEAAELEALLRHRGRPELLARALTHRMTSAESFEQQVEALRDLQALFTSTAEPEETTRTLLRQEAERIATEAERRRVTEEWMWESIVSALTTFVGTEAASRAQDRRVAVLLQAADEAEADVAGSLRVDAATLLEQLGQADRAVALYEELFLADPTHPPVWRAVADAHYARGTHDALFALALRATRDDPPADRAARHLAMARLALEKPAGQDVAIQCLEQVLSDQPDSGEAADLLIRLYEEDGRDEELIGLLEKRLRAAEASGNSEAVAMLTMRAGAVMQRVHPAAARATFESVVDMAPEEPRLLRTLVQRLDDLGSSRLADALERLVSVESMPDAARLARRLVMLRTGTDDPALLERALALGFARAPGEPFFANRLIDLYASQGRHRDAADIAARALEDRPNDADIVARLVTALRACGDLEAAEAALGRALEVQPGAPELLRARARLAADRGDLAAALADLEQVYRDEPDAAEELVDVLRRLTEPTDAGSAGHSTRLYDVLMESGQVAEARAHLDVHLERHPNDKRALERRASLAVAAKDHATASSAFEHLADLASEPADLTAAAIGMADASAALGERARARNVLERALRVHADKAVQDHLERIYDEAGERAELAKLLASRAGEGESTSARVELLTRAAALVLETDPGRALDWLRQARSLDDTSWDAAWLSAKATRELGDRAATVDALRALLSGDGSAPAARRAEAHLELAKILLEGDELFDALDELQATFRLDRKNPEAALLLGLVSIDVDDESTANRALRTVTAMGSLPSKDQKALAYYHLARLAHLKGDPRKAKLMATNATTYDPEHARAKALLDRL